MKIKKIYEKINIKSIFYFINNTNQINFIKSLNLTDDQYIKLADIMKEYDIEKYNDAKILGKEDGIKYQQRKQSYYK
jgi:hypothetical protein